MMKRIAILSMSWSDKTGVFSSVAKFTSTAPPMGICYLGSVAERAGWNVMLLDNEIEQLSPDAVVERLREFGPDAVGLSAMTPSFHSAIAIAERVRTTMPDVRIVVGGPHITALREKAFESCFDVAVIGEGEFALERLLKSWDGGEPIESIPGILFRDNDTVRETGPAEWIRDVDALPFPKREALRLDKYVLHLNRQGRVPATSVVGARGCPFRCIYCSEPVAMGKKARNRGAGSLVAEMKDAKERLGITQFCFLNSTLTLDREQMLELSEGIIKGVPGITWSGWTRADFIDREMIRKMKESGFARVTIALESADEEILRGAGRRMNLDQAVEGFRICHEAKLEVWCLAMIGLPGETEATIRNTVEFIRALPGVLTSSLSVAIPYPGTRLYEMAKNGEAGLKLLTEDFSKYQRYDGGVMQVGDLTPERMVQLQKMGLLRIHSTAPRALYILRNMGLFGALVSGFAILKSFFWKPSRNGDGQ